jgi:endonuclease/exonuclease/phosphatase family metal-dependent hydrolase
MKIKLISLNLYEGGLFFENIMAFFVKEQPDILCLQEVFNSSDNSLAKNFRSLEVLQNLLPKYFFYFSPESKSTTDVGKIDIGNAIFSRFPIIEKSTHFFNGTYGISQQRRADHDWTQDPKNMQHCVIQVHKQHINVFNLHGIWGLDGGDNEARLLMSEIIVDKIREKKKVFLMGDFNLRPNTKTIENIEQHLVNVFKGQLTSSFNLKHKDLVRYPGYATAVVDMFFASPDVKIVKSECPAADVSDHLALVCDAEIP